MRAWIVRYRGMWAGGRAVVLAETEEEARDLVQAHRHTVNFKDAEVEEVSEDTTLPEVIYNDNGDY